MKYDADTLGTMLANAAQKIAEGMPAGRAAIEAGFPNMSLYYYHKRKAETVDTGASDASDACGGGDAADTGKAETPADPPHPPTATPGMKDLLVMQMQKLHERTCKSTPVEDVGKLTIAMCKCAEQINNAKE